MIVECICKIYIHFSLKGCFENNQRANCQQSHVILWFKRWNYTSLSWKLTCKFYWQNKKVKWQSLHPKLVKFLKERIFVLLILTLEQNTWLLTILCPILGRPSLQDVLNRGFKKWSMGHMTFFSIEVPASLPIYLSIYLHRKCTVWNLTGFPTL